MSSTPVFHTLPRDPRPPMPGTPAAGVATSPTPTQPITYLPPDRTMPASDYLPPRSPAPPPGRFARAVAAFVTPPVEREIGRPGVPPATSPTPEPGTPVVAGAGCLPSVLGAIKANWMAIALVVLLAKEFGVLPSVSGLWGDIFPDAAVKAGETFRWDLGVAASSASGKFADTIDSGGTVEQAETVLETEFQTGRQAAFQRDCAPLFTAIVPANGQPTTVAQRAAYSAAWRGLRDGLVRKRLLGGW